MSSTSALSLAQLVGAVTMGMGMVDRDGVTAVEHCKEETATELLDKGGFSEEVTAFVGVGTGCGGAPTQGVVEATVGMFVGISGVGVLRGGKTAPFFSGRGSVGPVPDPTTFPLPGNLEAVLAGSAESARAAEAAMAA